MNKPTDKQVRELWEKYGFKIDKWESSCFATTYIYPNKDKFIYTKPRLDLNSLFKYAVPNDVTIQFQQHGENLDCVIFDGGEWSSGKAGRKEYALALFWALDKMRAKEKK